MSDLFAGVVSLDRCLDSASWTVVVGERRGVLLGCPDIFLTKRTNCTSVGGDHGS